MRLHGNLRDVLGSRTAAAVLRCLAERPSEERTVGEIARDSRTPAGSAARAVRGLEERGIVLVRREGRARLVRPNTKSSAFARAIAPALGAEDGALGAMVGIFRRAMRRAPPSVASAAVFGSVARREDTDGSDVDLLIISSAPRAALEFIVKPQMEAEARFDMFVSPLAMTKRRFRSPLNRNLARSIVRDHIPVYGERLEAILGRPAGRPPAPLPETAGRAAPARGARGTVRDVPRAAWRPYLARADELLAAAGHAFEAKSYNAGNCSGALTPTSHA